MESGKNVSNKVELCPIGITRLAQITGVNELAEEYKETAVKIALIDDAKELEGSPKSPKSPRKSRFIKSLKQIDNKIDAVMYLLLLLAKMEKLAGRMGLDAALDVHEELGNLSKWLKKNFTKEDKEELKARIEKKSKKDNELAKLEVLQNLIEKQYTPEMLRYSAHAIFAASLASSEDTAVQVGRLIKKTSDMVSAIDKKIEKSSKDPAKVYQRKLLKTKLEKLSTMLANANFASSTGMISSSKYSNHSMFASASEDYKKQIEMSNEKLKSRIGEQKYANFKKYEEALQLAIDILKDPMFPDKEKYEEEICRIILLYQSELDGLLKQSEKLQKKLVDENNVYGLAHEVAAKINFAELSLAFANGNRKQEGNLIKKMLGDEFQVISYGEEGEGNNPVYIVSKKLENKNGVEIKSMENSKEEESKELISNSNSQPTKPAIPEISPEAVVIRAQNMNEYDLQGMVSPKHLIQRVNAALDFSEPGFTKQYALMPGVLQPRGTGDDKVYRNYEISEVVPGKDLGKIFAALHGNITEGKMKEEEAINLLQLNFISYAKQLIQLFLALKQKGICYTDLKPSNILTSAKIKISDDKTAVNISHLKEGENFYPREQQPLQLTGGFYTPKTFKYDANKTRCYDMEQLSRDTLVITLFQLMSGENMEGPKHGHDFDIAQQSKLLTDLLAQDSAPIFKGDLGEKIRGFYKQLLSFMLSREGDLEALLKTLDSFEKVSELTQSSKPRSAPKPLG